jgi:hypothetical protein
VEEPRVAQHDIAWLTDQLDDANLDAVDLGIAFNETSDAIAFLLVSATPGGELAEPRVARPEHLGELCLFCWSPLVSVLGESGDQPVR